MSSIRKFAVLAITVCSLFLAAGRSEAGIDLPWSSTFACNDWQQGQPLSCDGLRQYSSSLCGMTGTQITDAANFPGGAGGKGVRFYKGDGTNVNSSAMDVNFNTPQSELWIRWYQRYQPGFQYSYLNYEKMLYLYANGTQAIPEWYGSDGYRIYSQTINKSYSCTNCGWLTTMGGGQADGKWHSFQVHLKMDTNGSNGIAEMWIDDVRVFSFANANFGAQPGWNRFHFLSNQTSVNNGGCNYVDVDDIAVSNTGFIGAAGTIEAPVPSAPVNLR